MTWEGERGGFYFRYLVCLPYTWAKQIFGATSFSLNEMDPRGASTVRLGRPKCSSFLAPDAQKLLPPKDAEEDFELTCANYIVLRRIEGNLAEVGPAQVFQKIGL